MNTKNYYSNCTYLTSEVKYLIREVTNPVTIDASLAQLLEQVAREFVASLTADAIRTFNGRLERGLELARRGAVSPCSDQKHPRRYQVRSSDWSTHYMVDLDAKSCECMDSSKGHTCKHRIAAYYYEQVQKRLTQVDVDKQKKPYAPAKPTCSVPPPKETAVRPTCSVQPTRGEFEQAEKRAEKDKVVSPQQPTKTEAEILAELGFAPEKPKMMEENNTPQLGTLYQRYLHGTDLTGQTYRVTIREVTKERVTPHPSQSSYEKWCLWVSGLPEGMPGGVLFGARGERDLLSIFGRISLELLKGKTIVLYPEGMTVAGQQRVSIRFRRAS